MKNLSQSGKRFSYILHDLMFFPWSSKSMQRFLVGVEDTEDADGVSRFIDGKGDEVRESLHGLAADVPVADSRGGR